MSAPDSSQVHHFQSIQNSSIRIYVGAAEAGAAEAGAKLADELQSILNSISRFRDAGIFIDRNGDDVPKGETLLASHEEGQRAPPTGENDQTLQHVHLSREDPDTEMPSPPLDESREIYDPLPTTQKLFELEVSVAKLKSRVVELEGKNEILDSELQQTIQAKAVLTSNLYNATQQISRADDLASNCNALNSELQQTIQEKAELSSNVYKATQERDDLSSRLYKVTQERDELNRQRQTSLLKIRKLNEMIIKRGQNSDERVDDDVLKDMFMVRNMTTEIIKRFFPKDAAFRPDAANDLASRLNSPYYSHFYRYKVHPEKALETRHRRLISLLFRELQDQFFGADARRFGLPKEMETKFQEFERMIEASNKVDAEESLTWRTGTVSYALRQELSFQKTIEDCTRRLAIILSPLVLPGDDKKGIRDKKEGENLFRALYDLCSASLKLALYFRSSKTKYEFKMYDDNTNLAACDEELIKKVNSEGPISKPMDLNKLHIFCTLFGALVKTRPSVSGEPGKSAILEPGQVIVYEPPPRGQPQ